MRDPYLDIARQLPLSRTEKEILKRYESDPSGRAFLPLADVLRGHKKFDDALELLLQGVASHPEFTVARVVLARELLGKGMVQEAWRTLDDSPTPLHENVLAQKLKYKLAILLGRHEDAKRIYKLMTQGQMLDQESEKIHEYFEIFGPDKAKTQLVHDLAERGIEVQLPKSVTLDAVAQQMFESKLGGLEKNNRDDLNVEHEASDHLTKLKDSVTGFHVVPLAEIFRGGGEQSFAVKDSGVEIDSTTLADIYAKQGYYSKALGVYRRILRQSPNNEFIRRKVAELSRLQESASNEDRLLDPAVTERLETLEIIDSQMNFLSQILNRLNQGSDS